MKILSLIGFAVFLICMAIGIPLGFIFEALKFGFQTGVRLFNDDIETEEPRPS